MKAAAKAEIKRRTSDGSWFSPDSAVGRLMRLVPGLKGNVVVEAAVPDGYGGFLATPAGKHKHKRGALRALGKALGSANKKPRLSEEDKMALRNEKKREREEKLEAARKVKYAKLQRVKARKEQERLTRDAKKIEADAEKRAKVIAHRRWSPFIHLSALRAHSRTPPPPHPAPLCRSHYPSQSSRSWSRRCSPRAAPRSVAGRWWRRS